MSTPVFTISPEMQSAWDDIMGQMCQFVSESNADIDMAYDWVCEMMECDGFVENETAWDSFYDAWDSATNVNEIADLVFS